MRYIFALEGVFVYNKQQNSQFWHFKTWTKKMVQYIQPICWLLPLNCLGMLDHLVGLGLQRLKLMSIVLIMLFKVAHMYMYIATKNSFVMLICDALRDLGSVTIWRLHGRSNACECMLTLFPTFMSFLSVCMS